MSNSLDVKYRCESVEKLSKTTRLASFTVQTDSYQSVSSAAGGYLVDSGRDRLESCRH